MFEETTALKGIPAFVSSLPLMLALHAEFMAYAVGSAVEDEAIKAMKSLAKQKQTPEVQAEIARLKGEVDALLSAYKRLQADRVKIEAKTHAMNITRVNRYKNGTRAQVSIRVGGKSYTRHLQRSGNEWTGRSVFSDTMMTYQLPDAL